jgi:ABC-2 type transport system permease protein
VNWAIEAGRNVAMEDIDWTLVLTRTGLLIAFLIAASVFAIRVFLTYQRSI